MMLKVIQLGRLQFFSDVIYSRALDDQSSANTERRAVPRQ